MSFQNNKGVNLSSGNNNPKCLCTLTQSFKVSEAKIDRTERKKAMGQVLSTGEESPAGLGETVVKYRD